MGSAESVRTAVQKVDTATVPHDEVFTEHAFRCLNERITDYISDLASQSARIAKRERADVISGSHVDQAASSLSSSRSRKGPRLIATTGGLLAGVGLPGLATMVQSNQFSKWGVIVNAALLVVGSILVAVGVLTE